MSILTFNLSVSDRKNVSSIDEPFQIMPSTNNFLTDKSISSYLTSSNPNILLHMNYITRVFRKDALELNSLQRRSLKQYVKLGKKLGTRNVLIHMPCNPDEYENLGYGFKVMYDELVKEGMIIHLEISAWSKDFVDLMDARNNDPKEYVVGFITKIMEYANAFPEGTFYIVFDTAHLFADGCESEDMFYIMNKFRSKIKYVHLNGNINSKYNTDSHVPIFSPKNKMSDWNKVCEFCASLGVVCVAEITKMGSKWEDWEQFANEFGFKLVKQNDKYSY